MVTPRHIFYYLTWLFSALWVTFAVFDSCFIALIFVSLSVVTFTCWFISICREESQTNYNYAPTDPPITLYDTNTVSISSNNTPIEYTGERIILFDD